MLKQGNRRSGFTIVELLIVVVVIAILATISIVAYTNITRRANDSAVQADLRGFAGKITEYQALHGDYPAGGRARGQSTSSYLAIPSVESYPFARAAYATDVNNIYYCERDDVFWVAAKSASGTAYRLSNSSGLEVYTGTWSAAATADTICTALLGLPGTSRDFSVSFAHHRTSGWGSMSR